MNELSLIRDIARWTSGPTDARLIAGIGDDCAILRPPPRQDLLLTTDMLIEGIHFKRGVSPLAHLGWKALARGLSDIAAMGGKARYALLSLALGDWTTRADVRKFYGGAMKLARRHEVRIVGGDVSRGERFMCDVVVVGSVPCGRALRRDSAQPGDVIYVTGALGSAVASDWKRLPIPRLDLATSLRRLKATACMDLSDGLSLDLHRLCLASRVSAEIESALLPVAASASVEEALHGGEDYELLVTISPRTRVPASLGLRRIGVIRERKAGRILLDGRALKPRGWDPLSGG